MDWQLQSAGTSVQIEPEGGSAKMFHELCDNKGPTVTIFFNTDNNVYGGIFHRTGMVPEAGVQTRERFCLNCILLVSGNQ